MFENETQISRPAFPENSLILRTCKIRKNPFKKASFVHSVILFVIFF